MLVGAFFFVNGSGRGKAPEEVENSEDVARDEREGLGGGIGRLSKEGEEGGEMCVSNEEEDWLAFDLASC